MLPDPKRKPGFYWVRFEGEVQVAEYAERTRAEGSKYKGKFAWYFCGLGYAVKDEEICELLSRRLTITTLAVK